MIPSLVSIALIFLQHAKIMMEGYIHKCNSQHQTKNYLNIELLLKCLKVIYRSFQSTSKNYEYIQKSYPKTSHCKSIKASFI